MAKAFTKWIEITIKGEKVQQLEYYKYFNT